MNNILSNIIQKQKRDEKNPDIPGEFSKKEVVGDRRSFIKKTALGGISIAALKGLSIEDTLAGLTSAVQRNSNPSDLRITDMRIATVRVQARNPIVRIDTNQGIYGLGEVRDGADGRYALMLKSRLLGLKPLQC
jgi:hypothetical protein